MDFAKFTKAEQRTIQHALAILDRQMAGEPADTLSSPSCVQTYLMLKRAGEQHEVFGVVFLDNQNRVIRHADLFRGTLTQCPVYPREVVKEALACNAAAVILTHNHPSGVTEPSSADRMLTDALREALATVDVAVLDHVITAGNRAMSFAERGLL